MIVTWILAGLFLIVAISLLLVGWLSRYEGITKPDPRCEHYPKFNRTFGHWHCTKCGTELTEDERLMSANAREHEAREAFRALGL